MKNCLMTVGHNGFVSSLEKRGRKINGHRE